MRLSALRKILKTERYLDFLYLELVYNLTIMFLMEYIQIFALKWPYEICTGRSIQPRGKNCLKIVQFINIVNLFLRFIFVIILHYTIAMQYSIVSEDYVFPFCTDNSIDYLTRTPIISWDYCLFWILCFWKPVICFFDYTFWWLKPLSILRKIVWILQLT